MTDAPTQLPLANLHEHPDNPRLTHREDVVAGIAAQLNGKLDAAHALIVRPLLAGGWQIISGHHRRLAAERAGMAEVPCWVREMSDADAYMALALNNAQGELHALEVGLHALKSGLTATEYADRLGLNDSGRRYLAMKINAAEVAGEIGTRVPPDHWRQLAEIHTAKAWLWRALAAALVADEWTVERTRAAVKDFKKAVEPPAWADRDAIAVLVLNETVAPDFANELEAEAQTARDRIAANKLDAAEYLEQLQAALVEAKPVRRSDVANVCRKILNDQEEALRPERERRHREMREIEERSARLARLRQHVSLDEWRELSAEERQQLLMFTTSKQRGFNKQENKEIEWAQWSWNPITGCLHDCPYCYARDIANGAKMRTVYPFAFAPTLHPTSLVATKGQKVPDEATGDTRFRNVFTGSMADVFGRWVPEEWVDAVLKQMGGAPEWNFLCLTKFPGRMAEFNIPPNCWMGTTVDLQARVAAAEKGFAKVKSTVRWLSCEPLLEPLRFKRLDLFQWIVIGGASKSSQTPEWRPPFEWVADLVRQARDAKVKVYFKTNLGIENRLLELPFDAPIAGDPIEAPAVFHYLKGA